jgi:hypothetical protein
MFQSSTRHIRALDLKLYSGFESMRSGKAKCFCSFSYFDLKPLSAMHTFPFAFNFAIKPLSLHISIISLRPPWNGPSMKRHSLWLEDRMSNDIFCPTAFELVRHCLCVDRIFWMLSFPQFEINTISADSKHLGVF